VSESRSLGVQDTSFESYERLKFTRKLPMVSESLLDSSVSSCRLKRLVMLDISSFRVSCRLQPTSATEYIRIDLDR
jgi:hypothetical protein